MRRADRAMRSIEREHRRENYIGPVTSTDKGGHSANMSNLYNAQVRDAKTVMPYGISSRPTSGMKAQAVVNDNSDSTIVGVFDPNRPQVGVGEICLYSSSNARVYLKADGTVDISGNVTINGRTIEAIVSEIVNKLI